MGGGDLNMKKHFHPLTQENLERVWKAEEKKRKEDERIEQLQQEIATERQKEAYEQQAIESGLKKKRKERLDWMYSGQQTVDTEAYLLGKKIDKNIAVGKEEEKGLSSGVVATSSKINVPKASDILAKIKEDPLFLIKKKEEDNKKYLMANTIKMRKMRELIQEEAESAKRGKKYKKSKKKKRKTSSSSEDSSDDGSQAKRKKEEQESSNERKESYKERTSNGTYHKTEQYNDRIQKRFYNDRTRNRHDSSSDEDEKLEAQRNEMMNNAKWRQSQREKHTKRYQKEKEAEERDVEDMLKKSSASEEKAYFVQKMQKESYSAKGGSVEDRIHRNIHSKQRTTASLNKKFTSR